MTNLFVLTRQGKECETRVMKIVLHTVMSQIFGHSREQRFSHYQKNYIVQSPSRTPGIVKGNNPLSLVWFK